MDLDKLVADLGKERDRLGRAISALLGSARCGLYRRQNEEAGRTPQGRHDQEAQARRLNTRRPQAPFNRDEEALGRAQKKDLLGISGAGHRARAFLRAEKINCALDSTS